MTVMQNGLMGETGLRRTMPHWPQPGLIPRDPARGDRLETIAYFGSDQYEPQFVKTGAFQDALRQRGVRFVNRFQGEWHDYQHVDAVLAIRDCPPVVLATKPASKLIDPDSNWLVLVRCSPYSDMKTTDDRELMFEKFNDIHKLLEQQLWRGIEDGSIRELLVKETAQILMSLVVGANRTRVLTPYAPPHLYREAVAFAARAITPCNACE